MNLKDLTVITITFNNESELLLTYKSLEEFRNDGGIHIIINGGVSVKDQVRNTTLIEEADRGIYDALNKGISLVQTNFFMLIHSGDALVESSSTLEKLLLKMESNHLDLLLNNCSIEFGDGKRLMKSDKWRPWMFLFGAQPPHPPTIYRTNSVQNIQYDLNHRVIADFKYLEDLFKLKLKYAYGKKLLIHMSAGGATSSGIKSFFYVNKQFRLLKGPLKMILFALTRPFIKIYQMI